MEQLFSNSEVRKIYCPDLARQTLINAEKRKDIPKSTMVKIGNKDVRKWPLSAMPVIGNKYGFLKGKVLSPQCVAIYTAKGGVLKTTLCYSIARIFALHGFKVLLIGLDVQCSITELAINPLLPFTELKDVKVLKGLYDFLKEDSELKLSDIIEETSLPTLHIVPETPALSRLERLIRLQPRSEYILSKKVLEPLKGEYDFIFMDNGPGWNSIVENSLTGADVVLSPVGCDLQSFQAIDENMESTFAFKQNMDLEWKKFILIPTLLANTKLSKQIYSAYTEKFPDYVSECSIRRTVRGEESLTHGISIIEHEPGTPLSNDYVALSKEIFGLLPVSQENIN